MKSIFSTQNLQTFFLRKYWRLPRRGPPGPPRTTWATTGTAFTRGHRHPGHLRGGLPPKCPPSRRQAHPVHRRAHWERWRRLVRAEHLRLLHGELGRELALVSVPLTYLPTFPMSLRAFAAERSNPNSFQISSKNYAGVFCSTPEPARTGAGGTAARTPRGTLFAFMHQLLLALQDLRRDARSGT